MGDVVIFVFMFLSELSGPSVWGYTSLIECMANRAYAVEVVNERAPEMGDAVYVGECQKVVLKRYTEKT